MSQKMTPTEAWKTLQYYSYKTDAEEYANNCSDEDGELYRQAEATISALVKANPTEGEV